jgi:hypothetical protein
MLAEVIFAMEQNSKAACFVSPTSQTSTLAMVLAASRATAAFRQEFSCTNRRAGVFKVV